MMRKPSTLMRFFIWLKWASQGRPVTLTAYPPQVGVPSEALHQVLDVWDLFELSEHQGSEILLGVILN